MECQNRSVYATVNDMRHWSDETLLFFLQEDLTNEYPLICGDNEGLSYAGSLSYDNHARVLRRLFLMPIHGDQRNDPMIFCSYAHAWEMITCMR